MKQRHDQYFAVTLPGLEAVCARELEALGLGPAVPVAGGVEFAGGLRELYLANLWLRSATRILVRLGEFTARDFPSLYRKLVKLPWGRFVRPGPPCEVRGSCRQSRLSHSGRVAETVVEAIAHALGQPAQEAGETQLVFARLDRDRCLLSVDSSGELLHRRGYRRKNVAAPLRETLAAGILQILGWDGRRPLVDAMTGSGTFAIEAALMALHRPPGARRRFAFMEWPGYRAGLWRSLLEQAERSALTALPVTIRAVDVDAATLAAARQNAASAGVGGLIDFALQPMQQLLPEGDSGLILCNPPYGERLGRNEPLEELYADLGQLYRGPFAGWQAALLSPDRRLARATGLSCRRLLRFSNGGLQVELLQKK